MTLICIFLVFGVGLFMSAQSPTNAALGRHIGVVEAGAINFFVGSIILIIVCIFLGGNWVPSLLDAQPWQLFGGIYGAFCVYAITLATPKLGVSLSLALAMLGQLITGMIVDQFGLFAVTQIDLNGLRLIGCAFALFGIIAIYFGNTYTGAEELITAINARKNKSSKTSKSHVIQATQTAQVTPLESNPAENLQEKSSVFTTAIYSVLSFAVGCFIAIQSPTNAALATHVGTIQATLVNFLVGFAILLIASLIRNKGKLPSFKGAKAWHFTGGVYGSYGVSANAFSVVFLGVGLLQTCTMLGQLIGGIIVDALGLFETRRIKINGYRLAGAILLLIGIILVAVAKIGI